MEEVIIPFQVAKGMVICGSFAGEDEADLSTVTVSPNRQL